MFKKLFGINKVEKNLNKVNGSLSRSWEWIAHLNNISSDYERRIIELEEGQKKILDLVNSLFEEEPAPKQVQKRSEAQEVFIKLPEEQENPFKFSNKTLALLQIMYGYAAFNPGTAITTSKISEHVNYKITERGLRKKLTNLEEQGLLKSLINGNSRFWYFNSDKLMKVKRALTEQ